MRGGNAPIIVVFELTNSAGFFSTFWFLCKAYLYAKENNWPFFIESTSWQYTYKDGWHDYFKTLTNFKKDQHPPTTDIKRYSHNNIGNVPDYSIRRYIDTAIKEIYILNDNIQQIINDKIKEYGTYKSLYIRRGDKTSERIVSTAEILAQTSLKDDGSRIFVQTDDYRAVEEVKAALPSCIVLSIVPKDSVGANNGELSSKPPNIRKAHTEEVLVSNGILLGSTEGWTYSYSNVGAFHKLSGYDKIHLYIDSKSTKESVDKIFQLDSVVPMYKIGDYFEASQPTNTQA